MELKIGIDMLHMFIGKLKKTVDYYIQIPRNL